jgi:hypothetical protein
MAVPKMYSGMNGMFLQHILAYHTSHQHVTLLRTPHTSHCARRVMLSQSLHSETGQSDIYAPTHISNEHRMALVYIFALLYRSRCSTQSKALRSKKTSQPSQAVLYKISL